MKERDRLEQRLDELKQAVLDGYDSCGPQDSVYAVQDAVRAVSRSVILQRWIVLLSKSACRKAAA